MTTSSTASKTLDGEFLGIRCRLIELAASMDRIERHDGSAGDPRLDQIRRSLDVIASDMPNRAERVQLEFSLPYDDNWRG